MAFFSIHIIMLMVFNGTISLIGSMKFIINVMAIEDVPIFYTSHEIYEIIVSLKLFNVSSFPIYSRHRSMELRIFISVHILHNKISHTSFHQITIQIEPSSHPKWVDVYFHEDKFTIHYYDGVINVEN